MHLYKNMRNLGRDGESAAERFLRENNAVIVERNFYFHGGEIDLIILDTIDDVKYLCFVEVKYRSDKNKGYAEEAVTISKQKKIIKGAYFYMNYMHMDYETPCRFDVVAINGNKIRWIKNAFTL